MYRNRRFFIFPFLPCYPYGGGLIFSEIVFCNLPTCVLLLSWWGGMLRFLVSPDKCFLY
uniref:Uncharacterized protein n=1 Tax=Rhizophora mucronata TaxID=61149 RepID=A0A2P2K167_RHIMU